MENSKNREEIRRADAVEALHVEEETVDNIDSNADDAILSGGLENDDEYCLRSSSESEIGSDEELFVPTYNYQENNFVQKVLSIENKLYYNNFNKTTREIEQS